MRIAVLVKQVPKFEEMELGPDGRLRRDGIEPEMNPYCRRAVSKAVELAAERAGSRVVVFTLGPPAADDTLREAIAWGLERDVDMPGAPADWLIHRWFAGNHSDIGGSYPEIESRLSDIALHWMAKEAEGVPNREISMRTRFQVFVHSSPPGQGRATSERAARSSLA